MNCLLIFIKNPILGKVKTRLAATVGDVEALHIYQFLLDYTRQLTEQLDLTRLLFYSDFIEKKDNWSESFFLKKVQKGYDLGERMYDAFEVGLENHQKAVIIGSDCKALTTTILSQAFASLNDYDVVLGPAQDGGYYLLGLKKNYSFLFKNIIWSSENVLRDTLIQAQKHNLSYFLLETLSDIDTEQDWIVAQTIAP